MTRDEILLQLEFYQDLGITTLFRAQTVAAAIPPPSPEPRAFAAPPAVSLPTPTVAALGKAAETQRVEPALPKIAPVPPAAAATRLAAPPPQAVPLVVAAPPSMLDILPPLEPVGDTLLKISEDIGDCKRCRLCEGRNKIVFGTGNERAPLVFVGEGPGADEDASGIPFVGRAGQLLTQMIEGTAKKEGIAIQRKDVYICNVVKCRPPENRTPQPDEMEICGQFLARQLSVIQPKAICALGSTAAKAVLGTKDGVTRLRGKWHKWKEIPVMVTYHPSYLLRPYNQDAKREAWEDLKKVLHYVYD